VGSQLMIKLDKSPSLTTIRPFRDLVLPIFLQLGRRTRASLAHLITTLVASCMIIALFLYVFSDFINTKLPSINPQAANFMRFYLILILIVASAIAIMKWSRDLMHAKGNWPDFLRSIGCATSSLQRATALGLMTSLALGHLLALIIINLALGPLSIIHILTALGAIALSMIIAKRPPSTAPTDDINPRQELQHDQDLPLIQWRKHRLARFGWRSSHLQIMSLLIMGMGFISLGIGNPIDMTLLICLIGGNILSWTVPLLVEEDLQFTWLERQAAVSHGDWIMAWQAIFTRRAGMIFGLSFILFLLAGVTSKLMTQGLGYNDVLHISTNALLASALASFPCWLAPSLVLQIDGRRIFTNIVMLTLINLFIGTAMMAVPWITPAIWILQREAHRYQGGRFARASNN